MDKLNIDSFGEVMDQFIKNNHVQLVIEMPEGTTEAKLKDNTGLGCVVQFYIILNVVGQIYKDLIEQADIKDTDGLADELCNMLKESMKKGGAE